jgi:hypothetical protein
MEDSRATAAAAAAAAAAAGRSVPANNPGAAAPRLAPAGWRRAAAWAADRQSRGARRWIQVALGIIWLLDAALQYQPYMFSRAFPTQVIEPAGAGSPGFVAHPVMFAGQLMLHNEIVFNALFATIQLAIAAGLLWRPTVRAALAASIVWALLIWWLGEGLGGVLTSAASPITGAPGGAVLYALIAVLAWPSRSPATGSASVADGSPLGGRRARIAWLALWGSGAYFLLLAANRAAGALRATVTGGAGGEPGWIAAAERGAGSLVGTHSTAVTIGLAILFAIIAAAVFVPAATRPALVLAVLSAAAIWLLGQSLGEIATGQATDPNTGLLLILLAAAYWPLARSHRRPAGLQAVPAPETASRPA